MFDHLTFHELAAAIDSHYYKGNLEMAKKLLAEMRTRLSETEFHEDAVRQG